MSDYESRIRQTLVNFTQPGDTLRCVGKYQTGFGKNCEMCGHVPIYEVHLLMNLRTDAVIRVGSKCIENYVPIYEDLWHQVPILQFSKEHLAALGPVAAKYPQSFVLIPTSDADQYKWVDEEDKLYDDDESEPLEDLAPEGLEWGGMGDDEYLDDENDNSSYYW